MARSRLGPEVLGSLKAIFDGGTPGGRSDAELLDRCARGERDEHAFAALVDRHRAMVLRACLGVLGDPHAAEDAAQATFLVLARKAGTLRRGETIAPWLYGVAVRVAAKMRVAAARRRKHERIGAERRGERLVPAPIDEVGPAVIEEVGRLPEPYRAPVVLCYFEGLSHEEAARRLGWPVGTVRGRLARARDRLRGRLERRGLSPSSGFLAALSPGRTGGVAGAAAGGDSIAAAALRFAAGGPGAAGTVPGAASIAARDVLRDMLMIKLKGIGTFVFVSAALAGGAVGLAQFGTGGFPAEPGVQGPPRKAAAPTPEVAGEAGPAAMPNLVPNARGPAGPVSITGFGVGSGSPEVDLVDLIAGVDGDPAAVDALVEVALMDLALAKRLYEDATATRMGQDMETVDLSPLYQVIRADYVRALVQLAEIRNLLREGGSSPEDLPAVPTLDIPNNPPGQPFR